MNELSLASEAQPVDTFATIPDVSIQAEANRVNPNQVASGVARGTQKIVNTDGSYMTLGVIPDGSNAFGIAFFDSSGTLIQKIIGVTRYIYDKTTNKNVMQDGKLPDGTYGWAVADVGRDISEGF